MSQQAPSDPTHTAPKPAKSPLVIVLAVLLGLLLVSVGFFIGRTVVADKTPPASPTSAAPGATAPSKQPGEADAQSPGKETQAGAEQTIDPEILELIRAQPKREDGDPFARGNLDAPVVMVEYSDFSCPFCAQFATSTLPQLDRYVDDGTLRIEWRDLALFPEGQHTAAAARAAAAQGKFWQFHNLVFADHSGSGHPDYSVDDYVNFAREAGVGDLDAFRADVESEKYLEDVRVATDKVMMSLGMRGTPAFIINDQVISGAQPAEVFIEAIESQKP